MPGNLDRAFCLAQNLPQAASAKDIGEMLIDSSASNAGIYIGIWERLERCTEFSIELSMLKTPLPMNLFHNKILLTEPALAPRQGP